MKKLLCKERLQELSGIGYTEQKMSDLTGIPQPTIHRILTGKQEPRETNVRLIDSLYAKKRREIKRKAK